jgi:hypothetical protein
MALSPYLQFDIASSILCGVLIVTRCTYRFFYRCRAHRTCHRQWRIDDAFMAFALLPLLGRTVTITTSFVLDPAHSYTPPTIEEADAAGLSVAKLSRDRITANQLILPARICYALFLWSLKLCLLSFYSRFMDALDWGQTAVRALRIFIITTFVAVLITVLAECRPLHLVWDLAPLGQRDSCARGVANLMTMAIFNILTDIALILLPFPILRFMTLDRKAKLQLSFLFGVGVIVVGVTVLRIPLILIASVSQRSRSMWASIEMLCACIVANTAFFYAIAKDLQAEQGHSRKPAYSPHAIGLDSLPSSHLDVAGLRRAVTASSKQAGSVKESEGRSSFSHV